MRLYKLVLPVLLMLMVGCSPSIKLKRAERLIKRAIAQGAIVHDDTTYKKVTFTAPKMTFETRLNRFKPIGDTIYLPGKTGVAQVITRIVQRPGTTRVDTVMVVNCPEQAVETKAPISIDRTIDAGYTFWNLLLWFVIGVGVGFGLYFLLRIVLKLF